MSNQERFGMRNGTLMGSVKCNWREVRLAAWRPGERDCGNNPSLNQCSVNRDEGLELESSGIQNIESTGIIMEEIR